MKENVLSQKRKPQAIVLSASLMGTIVFSLLLFYFDEGRNSFHGLFDKENLGALAFYAFPMIGSAILIHHILVKYLKNIYALMISALAGPIIGFSMIIGFFIVISMVL